MEIKSTQELFDALSETQDIDDFLEKNHVFFDHRHLADFLSLHIKQKGLKRGDVIRASQLSEVYAYQILNGTKYPHRDKVICLLLAMRLTLDESQTLLKVCGYAPLYAKNERDCILIYALNNDFSVVDTQYALNKAGLKLLNI